MAQETGIGGQAQEYRAHRDRAEKDLNVVPYCLITIERTRPDGTREVLHRYDMPRSTMWDWQWVYEWRKARYVCKYPRDRVSLFFSFYDKTTGLSYETDSLRSRQVAARALITRYTKALDEYIARQRTQLFFDPSSDTFIAKTKAKIDSARKRLEDLTHQIETILENQQQAQ